MFSHNLRFFRPLVLACVALLVFLPISVSAKPHKHSSKSDPEWVPPDDWPTGARVKAFLQTYLEQSILAPLDSPALPPRVALGALGNDFAAHLAAGPILTERVLYADAANLCNLLGRLLDERERRQDNLLNLRKTSNAVNPLDQPAAGVSGHYSWNEEAERARAQHRQEVQARLNAVDKKDFFVSATLREWTNMAAGYRRSVQAAAIQVEADQIRADAAAKTLPSAAALPAPTVPPAAVPPTVKPSP